MPTRKSLVIILISWRKTLVENGIKDKSDRIYNCDESGMQLDSTNDLVLAPRGSRHVYSQAMGTREHITVHICVCADGKVMPPMIIFAKGYPGGRYAQGGPSNVLYAKSESGYMDGELYLLWFKKIFLCQCSTIRPVMLVQDGHKLHITPELIDLACKEKVILFKLPPHTTHVVQPLDKSIFKPLKKENEAKEKEEAKQRRKEEREKKERIKKKRVKKMKKKEEKEQKQEQATKKSKQES